MEDGKSQILQDSEISQMARSCINWWYGKVHGLHGQIETCWKIARTTLRRKWSRRIHWNSSAIQFRSSNGTFSWYYLHGQWPRDFELLWDSFFLELACLHMQTCMIMFGYAQCIRRFFPNLPWKYCVSEYFLNVDSRFLN